MNCSKCQDTIRECELISLGMKMCRSCRMDDYALCDDCCHATIDRSTGICLYCEDPDSFLEENITVKSVSKYKDECPCGVHYSRCDYHK